eukprot:13256661-Alexandrium_andersonii.AAC.1
MAAMSTFQRRHEEGEFENATELAVIRQDRAGRERNQFWVGFPYRDFAPVHGSPPVTDLEEA